MIMMWGKLKESGIWFARASDWRLMWCGHDALYIAAGRLRLRVMKPFVSSR
jgi:hypothetical protein